MIYSAAVNGFRHGGLVVRRSHGLALKNQDEASARQELFSACADTCSRSGSASRQHAFKK